MRACFPHPRLGDAQVEIRAGCAFNQRIQLRIVKIFPPCRRRRSGIGFAAGQGFTPVRRRFGSGA